MSKFSDEQKQFFQDHKFNLFYSVLTRVLGGILNKKMNQENQPDSLQSSYNLINESPEEFRRKFLAAMNDFFDLEKNSSFFDINENNVTLNIVGQQNFIKAFQRIRIITKDRHSQIDSTLDMADVENDKRGSIIFSERFLDELNRFLQHFFNKGYADEAIITEEEIFNDEVKQRIEEISYFEELQEISFFKKAIRWCFGISSKFDLYLEKVYQNVFRKHFNSERIALGVISTATFGALSFVGFAVLSSFPLGIAAACLTGLALAYTAVVSGIRIARDKNLGEPITAEIAQQKMLIIGEITPEYYTKAKQDYEELMKYDYNSFDQVHSEMVQLKRENFRVR